MTPDEFERHEPYLSAYHVSGSAQIVDNVRGADVYIIQPTCPPVNDNLMEVGRWCEREERGARSEHTHDEGSEERGARSEERGARSEDTHDEGSEERGRGRSHSPRGARGGAEHA